MKCKKLLVLSVLALTSASTAMAVEDIRQKPEPAVTQGFEASESTDTYFYLYNVGAKAFFTQGNAWGTQASVSSTGLKVAFTPEGDYYLLNDYVDTQNAWKYTFFDSETAMFVDHNGQANYFWGVEENGSTFRLFASDANPGWDDTYNGETDEVTEHPGYRAGQYVGLDAATGGTALSPYLTVADGHYIDWVLVAPDVYDAYKDDALVYDAAQALKAALEEAEAINAGVADQLAVYNNLASTVAELNAATTATNAAIEKRKAEMVDEQYDLATWDKPVVVTDKFVKNPDFKGDDLTTGWSGDAFGSYGPKENAEHYNKTYNTYQQITGLKPGIYAVGVKAFYRAGDAQPALDNYMAQNAASKYAKLYATANGITREVPIVSPCAALLTEAAGVGSESSADYTDETTGETTTYWFPNNMEAAEYYMHTLGLYDNKVLISVKDTLTIGVSKSVTTGGDWSIFDDFSLTYYGQGADACQNFLDEAVKEYGDIEIEEGTVYTEQYLTAYRAALQGDMKASNLEELDAVLSGLDDAKKEIDTNIQLWQDWQALVENIRSTYVIDDEYANIEPEIDDLGDYVDFDAKDIVEAKELTNEELEAEMAKLNEWVTNLVEKSKNDVWDQKDMTKYITNPGFDEDKDINSGLAEGWTVDNKGGGNVVRGPLGQANKDLMESSLGTMNYCFEAWHSSNFDVWQEVTDLPVGMYEVQVQGYVRYEGAMSGNGDTAINIWNSMGNYWDPNSSEIPASPISLYMNNAQAQFPNIFSEPKPADKEYVIVESWTKNEDAAGNEWPNSMGGAAQAFAWGLYKSTAYGLIAKPGDKFRIGVKGQTDEGWWCIFDSFKLTYRTPTADVVKPVLEDALKTIDVSQPMGKSQVAAAQAAADAANQALAGTDGQAMFDALVGVYDATGAVTESVNLFKTLASALEELSNAINESVAARDTRSAAEALYSKIADGMNANLYENDELDGLKEDIAKMVTQLGLPADMASASDTNPVECTTAIVNPDYAIGSDKGWTGSAAINSERMDAEKFNTNFNYYQVLQGMPAGVYQVEVQGYYRAGNADVDYTTWVEDAAANNNAFLYAVGENADTCAVPVMRLASQAVLTDALLDGWVWASQADQLAVPNSMATGADQFFTYNEVTDKNYYEGNVVTVKVGEDGRLTIGLKKTTTITNDWTLWSNWKLTYFGKDSQLQPDADATAIDAATAAVKSVEYFNLGGARVTKPGKGVTIVKQTLGDGTVKVQKVTIK